MNVVPAARPPPARRTANKASCQTRRSRPGHGRGLPSPRRPRRPRSRATPPASRPGHLHPGPCSQRAILRQARGSGRPGSVVSGTRAGERAASWRRRAAHRTTRTQFSAARRTPRPVQRVGPDGLQRGCIPLRDADQIRAHQDPEHARRPRAPTARGRSSRPRKSRAPPSTPPPGLPVAGPGADRTGSTMPIRSASMARSPRGAGSFIFRRPLAPRPRVLDQQQAARRRDAVATAPSSPSAPRSMFAPCRKNVTVSPSRRVSVALKTLE